MIKYFLYLSSILLFLASCSPKQHAISGASADKLSVTFYGAKPNDGKDDSQALMKALKAKTHYLSFPPGIYNFSKGIVLPNDIHIEGKGKVTFKATKKMKYLLTMESPNYSVQHFQIENVILDGNSKAEHCIYLYKVSQQAPAMLDNVRCIKAKSTGAIFKACQTSSIQNLSSNNNGKNGMEFLGCNGMQLYSLSAMHNKNNGIEFCNLEEGKAKYSGGLTAFGTHAEGNKKSGVVFKKVITTISIYGGWIEGNTKNGVLIENSNVTLDGIRISGKADKKQKVYPVHIAKDKKGFGSQVIIDNCFIVNGQSSLIDIFDENKSKNTKVRNIKKYNHIKE